VKRILFVDDQPEILEGLRDLLHGQRREWEMSFAPGPDAALAELEAKSFDVIVSDMRMPKMDGATLLARVRDRWPDTVRIILSGHTEVEAALRAVPVAHQFLAKPCSREVLRDVIERACRLRELLANEAIRSVITEADSLPSVPHLYTALMAALAEPEPTPKDVSRIIAQDVAMSVKLLQLVNSAFFGLGRRIANVHEAVVYLGLSTIKNLVLSIEVFHAFADAPDGAGLTLEELHEHSLLVGRVAAQLAPRGQGAHDAYMAGLLHDVGKLILLANRPGYYAEVVVQALAEGRSLHAVEEERLGVSHAEIGAYLLSLWGLPNPIVEAVANHHAPGRVETQSFDLVAAVHVANALVHEQGGSAAGDGEQPMLDEGLLAGLAVASQLPTWRALVAKEAHAARTEAV